jgi:hypothetical protein
MTTVLSNLKNIGKKLTPLTSIRSNLFSEKSIEKLISNKNLKEIELSMNSKDLLELKKRIIIYRIKKLRNDSALLIQKMWGKYLKKLNIHKLAHHLTGCYTVSISSKGRTKAFIKIFCDETNKDCYKIQRLRYCPIRNCFAIDIPKNKFYTPKKIMHFIFLNRNKEKFFDENYKKVYFVNEYVHQIDFSCYDKNQKICEEAAKKEKERQKQNDINNLSTEDEKEYSEKYILTPTPERNVKFKFDIKNKDSNEEDEYSELRAKDSININESFNKKEKRFESFDSTYSCGTKLKSILKDSNIELLRNRRSNRNSFKKVSFGKTEIETFSYK